VVIDPEVLDVFPDGESVNEALDLSLVCSGNSNGGEAPDHRIDQWARPVTDLACA